jgi:hypothetical protein
MCVSIVDKYRTDKSEILMGFVEKSIPYFKKLKAYNCIKWDELEIIITHNPFMEAIGTANYDTVTLNMAAVTDIPGYMKILAHELVHIQQYHSGVMHYDMDQKSIYYYDMKIPDHKTFEEYWKSPEEVEAIKYEYLGRKIFNQILSSASATGSI